MDARGCLVAAMGLGLRVWGLGFRVGAAGDGVRV